MADALALYAATPLRPVNVLLERAPRISRFSITIHAGMASGGVLAPPIFITPRSSFQKLSGERVTAPARSMTGRCPDPSGIPRTTMGAPAVPTRQITHLSLYGVARA